MKNKAKEIALIQTKLNSEEYVNAGYFVPNHLEFRRLVCVNHITALYLSGNYQPIPNLIKIARMEMCEQPEIEGFELFSELAMKYLDVMDEFINEAKI